ncbi:GatB/YqeY domain-containing protein [Chloroflexi bacterium TSY]|nr:GatB/YqeY domain-containing protein [Chloroflexi bacterium TSY]
MTLQEQINADLKVAMLNKDDVAKLTLRAVKTALTVESTKTSVGTPLDDQAVQKIIQQEAKHRRDAASAYDNAGQPERARDELAELAVLERYLPTQLTDDEIEEIVQRVLVETGASSMRDMGQVMSAVMTKVSGSADGKRVNQIVRQLLSKAGG